MAAKRQFFVIAVSILLLTAFTLFGLSTSARANSSLLLEMDSSYAGQGTIDQPALEVTRDFVRLDDGGFIAVGEDATLMNGDAISLAAFTPNGVPDEMFGVNGVVADVDIFEQEIAVGLDTDSQGRLVVLVDNLDGGVSTFALLRFLPNGQPDTTFGTEGRVIFDTAIYHLTAYDVAVSSDDRILVLTGKEYDPSHLYRFTTTGSLDSSFGTGGAVIANEGEIWRKLLIESDNTIVIAGGRNSHMSVWRLTAAGSHDATFGNGGIVEVIFTGGSFAHDVVLTSEDTYVVAGYSGEIGMEEGGFAIARLTLNGNLDPTFDGDGRWAYDFDPGNAYNYSVAQRVGVSNDGTITIAGSQNQTTHLIQLLEDGSFNPTFGVNGITEPLWSNFQLSSSSIFYGSTGGFTLDEAGNAYVGGVLNRAAIQKFTPMGRPDFDFGARGWAVFGAIRSLKVSASAQQPDGKTVLAVKMYGDPDAAYVTRVLADGTPDLAFGTNGITQLPFMPAQLADGVCGRNTGDCAQLGFDSQGRIVVMVNSAIARLLPDGSLDSAFVTDGVSMGYRPHMFVQSTGHVVISYKHTENEGGYSKIIRLLPNGSPDPAFGTSGVVLLNACPDEEVGGRLSLQADDKILHLGDRNCNGPTDTAPLHRLTPEGQLDTTFGTAGISQVPRFGTVIEPLSNGKTLIMGMRYINNQNRPFVMRLNADGSLDATFGTEGMQSVALPAGMSSVQASHLVVDPQDGILILGVREDYTQRPYYRPFAVRLLSNGMADTTFGTDGVQILPVAYDSIQLTGAERWENRLVITYFSEDSQRSANNSAFFMGLRFDNEGPLPTVTPSPTPPTTTPIPTATATASPPTGDNVIFLPLIRR